MDRSALWGLGVGGSVLGSGSEQMLQSEDLRKSKATFYGVTALALQKVSSSYNLCGKLSPHTHSLLPQAFVSYCVKKRVQAQKNNSTFSKKIT